MTKPVRRIAVLAGLAASLAILHVARAQTPQAADPATPTPAAPTSAAAGARDVTILPDGARIVILPDPAAKEVVVDIFFKVGQSDEGKWPGINALITRSWISASDNRDAEQLQGDIARTGGAVGTASGPDWTELWGACAPDSDSFGKLTQALLAHIVAAPLFEETSVTLARADQLRALALRHDRLLMDVMDEMQSRAYGDAPYGLPPLGTSESVQSIPWKQVGAYYRRYFRPERMIIVVAGHVTADDVKSRVVASLSAGGMDDVSPLHGPSERLAVAEPIPANLHERVVHRTAPAVYVADGYLAPGTDSKTGASDYATLLVLDAVLGGGKASRLFALRDLPAPGTPPIGYEVRSVLLAGRTQSLWSAYAVGNQSPDRIQSQLQALLHSISDGTQVLTEAELSHAKAYLKGRHMEARERVKDRAYGAGWAEAMGLGSAFDANYATLIDAVTKGDVDTMARKIFHSNPATARSVLVAQ